MRVRSVLLTLLVVSALPRPASAWHNQGHMAVARVAWLQLDEPQRKHAVEILQALPFKDEFLAFGRPANVQDDEWLFIDSATWPDWVKSPKRNGPHFSDADRQKIERKYSRPDRHFVNLPFVHPDEPNAFDAAAIRKQVLAERLDAHGEPRNAAAAIPFVLKQVGAQDISDEERAVALAWALHLIGDLHQPLHSASLLSRTTFAPVTFEPPEGDRGGNRLAVLVNANDAQGTDLHFFWDALQFDKEPPYSSNNPDARTVTKVVDGWLADAKNARDQFPELSDTDVVSWADANLELAKKFAYRDGDKFLTVRAVPAEAKASDLATQDLTALSPEYKQRAAALAEKRMVLAGYRLADRLKQTLKPAR